jgi:formyl-CoA transferase
MPDQRVLPPESRGDEDENLLRGVTVIDLGQIYNAPYATLLLAQAGAKVIKVEPPGGERNRKRAKWNLNGAGYPFEMMNANKLGVTLNLKIPEGRELLLDMAARADVLVENFRSGVMDRLGLGPSTLHRTNKSLVYASSSGFGKDSGYGTLAAMDVTIQAMSGAMDATGFEGDPPVKSGAAIADFFAGVHLFGGIVTALVRRERTGAGAVVDVAMMDAILPSMAPVLGAAFARHQVVVRSGNESITKAYAPYNMYATTSGHVVVAIRTDDEWQALATCLRAARIQVPGGLEGVESRLERLREVDELVEKWTKSRTTEEILAAANDGHVPCVPVRHLADVVGDPYFRRRGLLVDCDLPGLGQLPILRSPIRVGDDGRVRLRLAPKLGEHNRDVYVNWLGRSPEELHALQRAGVV